MSSWPRCISWACWCSVASNRSSFSWQLLIVLKDRLGSRVNIWKECQCDCSCACWADCIPISLQSAILGCGPHLWEDRRGLWQVRTPWGGGGGAGGGGGGGGSVHYQNVEMRKKHHLRWSGNCTVQSVYYMPNYRSAAPKFPAGNFWNIIRRVSTRPSGTVAEIGFRFLGVRGEHEYILPESHPCWSAKKRIFEFVQIT